MALPDNQASSSPIIADFLPPYDRYKTPLVDFEEGGIALYDGSQGTQVQIWNLSYNDDELDPDYGDITLTPETFGSPSVVLNVADVKNIAFAFNQNMDFIIAYELKTGATKYYFYETVNEQYETHTLPAGSKHPQLCLDDHRYLETGVADDILAYTRSGTAYYRQERDRYLTERTLDTGLGASVIERVGMTKNNRLKFKIGGGDIRLSQIVGDLCNEAGLDGNQFEVSELYPTIVRGFMVSSLQSSAECIRGLQRVYFFDMPEVDGRLLGIMRGRETLDTIYHDEIILGRDIEVETAREQELEFTRKAHLAYSCAENDYTATKQTSERLSTSVKVQSEVTVECLVNFEDIEAKERVDILHSSSWVELEGQARYGVPEKYTKYPPGAVLNVEIRPGVFKRLRLDKTDTHNGVIDVVAKYDRKNTWQAGPATVVATVDPPTPPPSSLPGSTTWAPMDLPALITLHDTLHYVAVGYGSAPAWSGAQVQREIGTDYEKDGDITSAATMGVLDEALGSAPALYTDITNTILVTTNKDLESVTLERLLSGANAAAIISAGGIEIIQFRDAVAEGGAWRLSYLLRGRLDTTPAAHSINDIFVLLTDPVVIPAATNLLDTTFNLRAPSYGEVPSDATPVAFTWAGESQTEWAPVHLGSTRHSPATNDWSISWVPRFRLGDPVNPIASLYMYGWRIQFTVGGTVVFHDVADPGATDFIYTAAQQAVDFGGAQSSFNDVSIMALNQFTGPGRALSEAV